jgi:hypothetical protein
LKNKILKVFIIITLFSCSNKFVKKQELKDYNLKQILKVKFKNEKETHSFKVYSFLNRKKEIALLNGVSSFNKHIFKLKINKNKYHFYDFINKKEEKGTLNNFKFLNLNKDLIFKTIDKKTKQPIVIKKQNQTLFILVKEQSSF